MSTQTQPVVRPSIPTLTPDQMKQLTQLLVSEFGYGFHLLLENAARATTDLLRQLAGGNLRQKKMVVLAGAGNCGATGFATARYLHNHGADVSVILSRPAEELSFTATHQHRLLSRCGLEARMQNQIPASRLLAGLKESEFVVDALVGSGLAGLLRTQEAFTAQIIRQLDCRVVALDLPTGLPVDPTIPFSEPVVKASATIAFGLPRVAHFAPAYHPYLGDLYLADIGIPNIAYTRLGLEIGPLFSAGELLHLKRRG